MLVNGSLLHLVHIELPRVHQAGYHANGVQLLVLLLHQLVLPVFNALDLLFHFIIPQILDALLLKVHAFLAKVVSFFRSPFRLASSLDLHRWLRDGEVALAIVILFACVESVQGHYFLDGSNVLARVEKVRVALVGNVNVFE